MVGLVIFSCNRKSGTLTAPVGFPSAAGIPPNAAHVPAAITAVGTINLAGNLSIYAGRDAFNGYAEHLHSLGVLLTVFEWILLILAIVHVITGLTLFFLRIVHLTFNRHHIK